VPFKLVYEKRFINDLRNVDKKDKLRIKNKLEWLADNIYNTRHIMLKGDEFQDVFKLRIGNWRVFYKLDYNAAIIYVLTVMDRKEAYKRNSNIIAL